jgi:alkylated DNA repair dioxygenase AlkB
MFSSPSLFDALPVRLDATFARCDRVALDETSWVDVAPGWLDGAHDVFTALVDSLPWRQRRAVPMYDRLVDEPRLTSWWRSADGPEPLPILAEARHLLTERYGAPFDSIGFNLYRDGHDSVAWHGDRHRRHVVDPVVAIVSVGDARTFGLRPRPTERSASQGTACASRRWELGHGDLLVMGGSCQHDWQHCVPKTRPGLRSSVGPRLSITFRHGVP